MIPRTKYCFTKGEKVALCYDGKWCRGVEGIVLYVWSDGVEVQFKPWANEKAGFVKIRCEQTTDSGFGGWLSGVGEIGIMRGLGCDDGDWYSLVAIEVLERNGCSVAQYDRQPAIESSGEYPEREISTNRVPLCGQS